MGEAKGGKEVLPFRLRHKFETPCANPFIAAGRSGTAAGCGRMGGTAAMERHHTFLFAVDEEIVIDGAVTENPAKYINHSCDPNCEPIVEGKQVFIDAIRDIEKGDELFYDYAYERDHENGDDESVYSCLCGSPKCRGSILAPKDAPDE